MSLLKKPTGSVLIWTMALGMIMTSVFLFMALRLSRNSVLSRETLEFLQEQAYLQSYVEYLQQLEPEDWATLKAQGITYEGLTGTLNNEVTQLKGLLDEGQSLTLPLNSLMVVEWNDCLQGILKEQGMLTSDPPFEAQNNAACGSLVGAKYNNFGALSANGGLWTLTSTAAPLHYRIVEAGDAPFETSQWKLNVELKLKSGRILRVKESWVE